jgi:hypothetical protein
MKRITLSGPAIRVLAVTAVVAAFILVIYMMAGLPAPREENRVRTANNQFSIIAPPDWEALIHYGANDKRFHTTMDIQAKKQVGLAQKIFIGVFREPPDLDKLKQVNYRDFTFQGKPALLWTGKNRSDYVWDMIFQRAGAWYNLVLRLNLPDDIPNSDWWPYLNSFQAQSVSRESTTSTTMAATQAWGGE